MHPISIFVISVLVINVLWRVINTRKGIGKKKTELLESFGKKPLKQSFNVDLIQNDWIIKSSILPNQSQIDEVTWYDLEMDQIYCEINNCKSFAGDQILYSILHTVDNQEADDTKFFKKIDFFESEETDRTEIWPIISGLGKSSDSYYLPVFVDDLESFKIPHVEYYRLMRLLLFFSFIPAVLFLNYIYLMFPFFIGLINIIIYSFQKYKYESYLNMLSGVLKTLSAAKQIADSPLTKYEQTFHDLKDNVAAFRKLYLKIGKLQHRAASNFLGDVMTLINSFTFGITLWDLIQYDKVIEQLMGLQQEFKTLYRKIGEIDAAISVASFRKTLPIYCSPIFCEDHKIVAEEVFHPLVKCPIYNSIEISKGCIITGSNASGKSTFIKAMAINAILGQSINTCIAKKFVMPVCSVITSMAVRDEVLSGESYYIREIRYLKRIIDALNHEKLVFCVIDEILRGTNTEERIAASSAILKYLSQANCIAVIATHDIELTELLGDRYANFHFTEQIREHEILFEYKLYPGPASSRNAIKLLGYMEFPKAITDEAEAIILNMKK